MKKKGKKRNLRAKQSRKERNAEVNPIIIPSKIQRKVHRAAREPSLDEYVLDRSLAEEVSRAARRELKSVDLFGIRPHQVCKKHVECEKRKKKKQN